MTHSNHNKLQGRRYRRARLIFLTAHPFCTMCEAEGRTQAAVELDHIIPHRGNKTLFWDEDNWQGLCKFHHSSVKAQIERSGTVRGFKADGTPIDPNHPWNTG